MITDIAVTKGRNIECPKGYKSWLVSLMKKSEQNLLYVNKHSYLYSC